MNEAYLASIIMFAGNFAPRGWAFCQGQILPIAQNTALFSLLGTTYGGNGQTTFALPDFRGRVAVGTGTGPGLPNVTLGEQAGSNTVTLISTQMPAHSHTVGCTTTSGDQSSPEANILAAEAQGATQFYSNQPINQVMNPTTIGVAGGSQPHDNMQPYLGMNYIICLEGIFPSRN